MTVLKTSLRNFFAHKGRMALCAVAVLLSVAFVCGTLVFTDTMSATFDKLFASTAADVTVSAPRTRVPRRRSPRTGRPETAAGLRASRRPQNRGRASPRGGRRLQQAASPSPTATTRTSAPPPAPRPSPATGPPRTASRWTSPPGTRRAAPTEVMVDADTADEAPPEARRRAAHHHRPRRLHGHDLRHRDLPGHQPRCGRRLLRHGHRPARTAGHTRRVHRPRR